MTGTVPPVPKRRIMKLKNDFITYSIGTDSFLVPVGDAGFSGVVKGNKTLNAILELLKQDTTEEAVIAAMCGRFDAPEDVIAADVKKVIANLRRIDALEE